MSLAVVTVAAGGIAVVDVTSLAPRTGMPVTEATNGFGIAVTKVVGKPGLPVVFDTIGVLPPVTYPTWSTTDKVNTNLTNGNLTATGSAANGSGRASPGYSTGKFYWEFAYVNVTQTTTGAGFGSTGASLPINTSAAGATGLGGGGSFWVNGVSQVSMGAQSNGNVIGIAVDLTANLIWCRIAPAGNWNGSGTANPATGVGGFSIAALTKPLVPTFYLSSATGQALTANFGASAFSGAVPAGFTSGWPA